MENRDDESDQGPRGNPNQSRGQKGAENDRQREGQGDKESVRPSPSGVPNEGRGQEIQQGAHQAEHKGQRRYTFKGGRQGQGGIPNPDDPDDHKSAGTFRGTADKPDEDYETRNPAY